MRSEFEFIRNIKKKYGLKQVGDDCAVLPKNSRTDLVVTADLLVEDVDFRLDWTTPEFLGHKALAVSLSDIAAMGATPKWAMLSLGVPEKVWNGKFVDKFYEGWFALSGLHGVKLVGGDVSRTPDRIVVDSIVGGEVAKGRACLRSGAVPGDSIFVTGSLGGASAGLAMLESGVHYPKVSGKRKGLVGRQLCPTPQVDVGKYLSSRGLATAMIDISDGLGADLHHLCDASRVGARIEIGKIPLDTNLASLAKAGKMKFALGGGEDFELLFTSKQKQISRRDLPPISRIGEVTAKPGIVELVGDGLQQYLPRTGYQHF